MKRTRPHPNPLSQERETPFPSLCMEIMLGRPTRVEASASWAETASTLKDRASNAPWFSLSLGERVGVRAVAFSDLHWQPLFANSYPLEIARNRTAYYDFARCVAASDPRMKSLQGQFQLSGNGVFLILLGNDQVRASQFWVFQQDASATIKEIPDRGERQ